MNPRLYLRDDLAGVWYGRCAGERVWRPGTDVRTGWADARLVAPLRVELMSRYTGGLIRSVEMTMHTDADGGLVPVLRGTMAVTPCGTRVAEPRVEAEAVWASGTVRTASRVTGRLLGTPRRRTLRAYDVPWCPLADDMGAVR